MHPFAKMFRGWSIQIISSSDVFLVCPCRKAIPFPDYHDEIDGIPDALEDAYIHASRCDRSG